MKKVASLLLITFLIQQITGGSFISPVYASAPPPLTQDPITGTPVTQIPPDSTPETTSEDNQEPPSGAGISNTLSAASSAESASNLVSENASATASNVSAPLPGDGDADGDVDGSDFLTWQRNVGAVSASASSGSAASSSAADSSSTLALGSFIPLAGDGNGDGVVNNADIAIQRAHYGDTSASLGHTLTALDGDFNGDGRVDGGDYVIWRGNFGAVAQAVVPVILDVPGIWPTWVSQTQIKIHVVVKDVPVDGIVELVYQVGQTDVIVTMVWNAASDYDKEYTAVITPPPGDFNVTIRVRQNNTQTLLCLPKSLLIVNTRAIDIVFHPDSDNITETEADTLGGIDEISLPINSEDRNHVEIRVYYWKQGATPPPSDQPSLQPIPLQQFWDDGGIVHFSSLHQDTDYLFRFEAWTTGSRPVPVGASEVQNFHTAPIRPVLQPTVPIPEITQTEVNIYVPIIQYPPERYDIAEAWLYVWADNGTPGAATRPVSLDPIRIRLDQRYPVRDQQLFVSCPVFEAEGCWVDDGTGSGTQIEKHAPIHLQGLKDGVKYYYQFEVRTQYETDPYSHVMQNSPTAVQTFTTPIIDPIVTPHVVDVRESETVINVDNVSGAIPVLPDTAEFRLFIWKAGSARPAEAAAKCTYKELQTGDCINKIANHGAATPWAFYVDKLKDGQAFYYQIEVWSNISLTIPGQTNKETPSSVSELLWQYDGTSLHHGNFTTIPIAPQLNPYVDQNTVTETEADLQVETPINFASFPSRFDIALANFCYRIQGSGATPICIEKHLTDWQAANWLEHIKDLTSGKRYEYWIDIYADFDHDGQRTDIDINGQSYPARQVYHSNITTFDTLAVSLQEHAQAFNTIETETDIKTNLNDLIPGGSTQDFINSLEVYIQYCESTFPCDSQPVRMDRSLTNLMEWSIHLDNLHHKKNYKYHIIIKRQGVDQPLLVSTIDTTTAREYEFTTLEMDFALTPSVPPQSVTESEADFVADNLVIPGGIRLQERRDIAFVEFCYKKTSAGSYDCEKIAPMTIEALQTQNWKVHVDQGLDHNTDYDYKIRIWADGDHDGKGDDPNPLFESNVVHFKTQRIAPVADPHTTPTEMETGFTIPIAQLPIRPGIVEARLFIWEDGKPRPTGDENIVQTFVWNDLDQLAAGVMWHFAFLKPDQLYRYQLEFWTNIPDVPKTYINEINEAVYDAGDPTPGLLFRTLPIVPHIDPSTFNVRETEVTFKGIVTDNRSVIPPQNIVSRWGDITDVKIYFWKAGDPVPASGTIPQKGYIQMSLFEFYEGYGSDLWAAYAQTLMHDTLFYYRIEVWTNRTSNFPTIPLTPQRMGFVETTAGGQPLSFRTTRIAPTVIPIHQNIAPTEVDIRTPIQNLPTRNDIALITLYYQTVRLQGVDGDGNRVCQGGPSGQPDWCDGEPVVDGNGKAILDTRSVTMSFEKLQQLNRTAASSADWFYHLTGLNHYSIYLYWIEFWTDVDHDGQGEEKVFDTRPLQWINDQRNPCVQGSPTCHQEPILRTVCVKNLSTNTGCYEDPDSHQHVMYDEPTVSTFFTTLPIAPYIVYAFHDANATNADIVALIDNLPPKLPGKQQLYNVYLVYWEFSPAGIGNTYEKEMKLSDGEWKIHLDDLQPSASYGYRVEVRTNIKSEPTNQPIERVAFRNSNPHQTAGTDAIIYLDADGIPIPMDNPTLAGQQLFKKGSFQLKLNLNNVPDNAAFVTLKLTFPDKPTQPAVIINQRVGLDHTITFTIPLSQFPQPNYTVDNGIITPDPPTFNVHFDLDLKGSAGILNDVRDFIMPNVAPALTFRSGTGAAIGLGSGSLLANAIATVGPSTNPTQFRTMTLDMFGLAWPGELHLTSQDPSTNGQTFTIDGKVGSDGKMTFVIPLGFNLMAYELTLTIPGGGTFVDTGSFTIPNSMSPDVAAHNILDVSPVTHLSLLASVYNTIKAKAVNANSTFWFEVWISMPMATGFPAQSPVTKKKLYEVQMTSGTISLSPEALAALFAQREDTTYFPPTIVGNWDSRMSATIRAKKISDGSTTDMLSVGNDVTYPLIKKGMPGAQAPLYAQSILDTFCDNTGTGSCVYRQIAASQLHNEGSSDHKTVLHITLRDKNGNTPYYPAVLDVPLKADGTIDTSTYSLQYYKNTLALVLAGANPLSTVIVSATMVEMLDGQIVDRLSETMHFGFGNTS